MIKTQTNPRIVRKIRRNIFFRQFDFSILNILWMNKPDLLDHSKFFQNHRAYEPVKIASRHKSHNRIFSPSEVLSYPASGSCPS